MQETNTKEEEILVAQDGSMAAQAAAQMALNIAGHLHMSVHGIYVVDETMVLHEFANYKGELGNVATPNSREELVTKFKAQGQVALEWLEERGRAAGVPVGTELLFGGVSDLILEQAAHARMLALGRRGHGHADQPGSLGGNFMAIAQASSLPMIVGGLETSPRLDRLLLAYDGSQRAQQALRWVVRLSQVMGLDVRVLGVAEEGEQAPSQMSKLKSEVKQFGLTDFRWVARSGQAAPTITMTAEEEQTDLIAMGGYAHGPLVEWIAGSTLDQVLRQTPTPVLVA